MPVHYFLFPSIRDHMSSITVFSRLNAGGVYLKLGLVYPAFIRTRVYSWTSVYLLNAFFNLHFSISVLEVY